MSDLRELAEAATPGPWVAEEYDGSTGIGPGPFTMSRAPLGYFSEDDYENTAFIAAANPTAVLALLDERDALREALRRLVREIDWPDRISPEGCQAFKPAVRAARVALEGTPRVSPAPSQTEDTK